MTSISSKLNETNEKSIANNILLDRPVWNPEQQVQKNSKPLTQNSSKKKKSLTNQKQIKSSKKILSFSISLINQKQTNNKNLSHSKRIANQKQTNNKNLSFSKRRENQKQTNNKNLSLSKRIANQKQTKSSGKFPKRRANQKQTKSSGNFLSISQLLANLRQKRQDKLDQQKKLIKPIIPPKTFVIILTEKPKKIVYNRRIIDYKHCGLLQKYLGLGGKILPRRQTRLTAKQQRFIAKAIKSARVMGLLPFVSKERGFFR